MPNESKIAVIGGGGVRTPLLIFGINEAAQLLGAEELVLYDPDRERAQVMADLGRAIVERERGPLHITVAATVEEAVADASFVLHSIRVGGIAARARDEKISIDNGYPGQETTGPGGVAMGLRTVAAAIEYARLVEKHSPDAWFINFTNPAGLITQALSHHTGARVVGICDTPTELFHRIALALGAEPDQVTCKYLGLNHLGWVCEVRLNGKNALPQILADDHMLSQLYSANLFDHELLRCLQLLPTEYLYFYYCRSRALENQKAAGTSRGEEIMRMNDQLFADLTAHLRSGQPAKAIQIYTDYLNQRSGSYMKLEASAGSAFDKDNMLHEDPFRTSTGYHRIALDVMKALRGTTPTRIVVNVPNRGAIQEVEWNDIVEVPCIIANDGIQPEACGSLPEDVRGLVLSVKAYERAAIDAVISSSFALGRKAMLLYPPIGEWEPSKDLMDAFVAYHPALSHMACCAHSHTE
jgi:6-phospho-beta-glucosidase